MRRRAAAVAVALSALACAGPAAAKVAAPPSATVTIWTDHAGAVALTKVAGDWAASNGVAVRVVEKNFGELRDDLATVSAAEAPDVAVAANAWTAALATTGLVIPIAPKKATLAHFPAATLDAFSYGPGVKRLYGVPVAVENIGLVVNTKLVRVPTTWSRLEKSALAFKKRKKGNLGVAVQQGANGDAYHMYPFFSGLGGYIFGVNATGSLDPADLGVANKLFVRSSPLIDRWNREGLISSKTDAAAAQGAFLGGRAAFWVTGPWSIDALAKRPDLKIRIVQVPPIVRPAVPLLGVQGYVVTRYAAAHGVDAAAKDLVGDYLATAAAQQALAAASGRYPASMEAATRVKEPYLRQFGRAGKGGVAWPNVPQIDTVWPDLGRAWAKSTRGPRAVKAATAFRTAARNIAAKIR